MAAKHIVALDINGEFLKIACLRVSAVKKEIIKAESFLIKGVADEEIAESLQAFFSALKPRPHKVICVVASNTSITKNIEVPSVDPLEIKNIVNLQATRHTPYPREEIIVEYITIGSYRGNYTKILLVIVPRKVVSRYLTICALLNLDIERVTFAPESSALLISRQIKLDAEGTPSGVLHVEDNFSEFIVLLTGRVIFIRTIPLGVKHLLYEREKCEERYLEEIKSSLDAYSNEDVDKPLTRIIITGGIENISSFEEALSRVVLLPQRAFSWKGSCPLSLDAKTGVDSAQEVSFLNVIGALVTTQDVKLDLVPDEFKLRKAFERRSREIVKTGILVMIMLVVICAVLMVEIYMKERHLRVLDRKLEPLQRRAQKLQKDYYRIKIVKKYLSTRNYPLEVLRQVYEVIPPNMRLHSIRFDLERPFSLKGTAMSISTVFNFVSSLEEAPYFEEVKSERTTTRKEQGKDVVDFEITATLVAKNNL